MKETGRAQKKWTLRAMDAVERAGNALPDPALLFVILTALTIAASYFTAKSGVSVSYEGVNSATGTIETIRAQAYNLLSLEGFHYMVTSVIKNFTSF